MNDAPPLARIDQVLHGYDRGHKQLASSLTLDDASRSTMASMSDLLTSTPLAKDQHYLAIYPLRSASAHVVARTWPAGEKFRPGSVWTHSFVLSYEALALLDDPVRLEALFNCPNSTDFSAYEKPVSLYRRNRHEESISDERVIQALNQIYGMPDKAKITIPRLDPRSDALLTLALWRQMWPALRRELVALSAPTDARRHISGAVEFQFNDETSEIAVPNSEIAAEAIGLLCEDFPQTGPTELRRFVSRYAIEDNEPRRLVLPLVWYFGAGDVSPNAAIKLMRDSASNSELPRFSRDVMLEAFTNAQDPEDFVELLLESKDERFAFDVEPLAARAASLSITTLSKLISRIFDSASQTVGERVYRLLIESLSVEDLAHIKPQKVKLALASERPDLINVPAFWPENESARIKLLRAVPPESLSASEIITIFGDTITLATASVLINHAPPSSGRDLLGLLASKNASLADATVEWIFDDPKHLGLLMKAGKKTPFLALKRLAERQVREREIFEPTVWMRLLQRHGQRALEEPDILALGSATSLFPAPLGDLELARALIPATLDAISGGKLTSHGASFLERSLARTRYGAPLSERLLVAFLRRWSREISPEQIFSLAPSKGVLDRMVLDYAQSHGRYTLQRLAETASLDRRSQQRIVSYLERTRPKRTSFFWFLD